MSIIALYYNILHLWSPRKRRPLAAIARLSEVAHNRILAIVSKTHQILLQYGLLAALLLLAPIYSNSQTTSFTAGAYIIDMGQATQTVANGLKPYGLVYKLIEAGIPVNWAIETTKAKDGIDFYAVTAANGNKAYKGGSFIIDVVNYPNALTIINNYKTTNPGVIVDGPTTASFSAPIYKTLTIWPRAFLDSQNDDKITPYYTNAGIPSSSYTINANPTLLPQCGSPNGLQDVYILPHADPDIWSSTWITALQNFINNGGSMWAGCHAVSVMENIPGCNFLSNNGLVLYNGTPGHSNGTPPYTYISPGNPFMQFIGILDGATTNGSEQIYVPGSSGWRNTTIVSVYDLNYFNTKSGITYPNTAGVVVYGPAYGDNSKGLIMYEAGHDLTKGTVEEQVAAQRAFFNFLLLAGGHPQTSSVSPPTVANQLPVSTCGGVAFDVTPAGAPANTTYTWTAPSGTGFTGGSAQSIPQTSISQTLANTTTGMVTAVYTVTPQIGGCQGGTFTVTVNIIPSPSLTSSLNPGQICSNTLFNYIPTSTTTNSFPWSRSAIAGISNPPNTGSGAISEILINATVNPIAVNYTYTLSANGCDVSYDVIVVVIPAPMVTASASSNAICSGGSINMISTSNTPAPPPPVLLNEDFNAATNNWTISRKDAASAPADWTLRPDGYITDGLTFNSNDNSQFYMSDSKTAKGETYLVSPALNTVGYKSLTLTYYHYFQDNGKGDEGDIQFSLNGTTGWTDLNPKVKYDKPQGLSTGFVLATVNLTVYINNPTFYFRFKYKFDHDKYWAIDNVKVTGESYYPLPTWSSIPAGFSSSEINPVNVKPFTTTTYTVIYKDPNTNCNGSASVTVTVNSPPIITVQPTTPTATCSGSGTQILSVTATGTGLTYVWRKGNVPVSNGGIISGQGTPVLTLTNPTNADAGSYDVVISGTCPSAVTSNVVVVTVNPTPQINDMTATICSGASFTLTPVDVTNGIVPAGTTYSWAAPIVTGGLTGGAASSGTPTNITGTLTNPTNSTQTATYTITPTTGSCVGNIFTAIVTVNPLPITSAIYHQ